ncbi:PspC domain-containing protein [Fodinibius halophilus]|uniref:PspC domain-containing protein n=1 Tax=Fodinibius halophilus TaxID=1736908 RepID=A0A6M1T6X8_9BACT|nr:PspC domain-containing protein [Fodinibius halophilus]NGP86954.1 PspC domain-containing protein [Fodinibius halophilus]
MAQRTKQSTHHNLDSLMDFEDHELQNTMQEFLEEEKKANTNIWNFATIAGIAMFFVGVMFILNMLIGIGPDLGGLMEALPLIGGALVTLVGFGFLVGDRKKEKQAKKKKKRTSKKYDFDYDFGSSTEEEDFTLNNDLGSGQKTKSKSSSSANTFDFDSYAFSESKKLYKSRTDKKLSGVCGGLAKYFGISSTVIRLLFIITLFAAGGASFFVYVALALALDKEPPEMMDDFKF